MQIRAPSCSSSVPLCLRVRCHLLHSAMGAFGAIGTTYLGEAHGKSLVTPVRVTPVVCGMPSERITGLDG
jgi:hypothetical protein